MHVPNSRIAIAPREMPTPSSTLAPVERLLIAAADAEVDGEAALVLEGIAEVRKDCETLVEGCEDCETMVGVCDMETMAVVAASRIDRSELCQKMGIPSPCMASAAERVVVATLNSRFVYGTT
jgi:hypothetical protein